MHRANHVRAEFVSQRLDMAVYGTGAGGIHPIPHLFEELLTGEHGLRLSGEGRQQVEFGGRQVNIIAVKADGALCRIDDQRAEVENLLVFRILGDDLCPVHPAQQRLATGD